MNRFVIDASVAVKWYFPEIHSEMAARWLDERFVLLVPDLLYAEFGNVLWKRVNRSEIDLAAAGEILQALALVPFQVWTCQSLMWEALEIAGRSGRSVYDCVYLSLAVKTGAPLVTADQKLLLALAATEWKNHVVWIEAVPR